MFCGDCNHNRGFCAAIECILEKQAANKNDDNRMGIGKANHPKDYHNTGIEYTGPAHRHVKGMIGTIGPSTRKTSSRPRRSS